MVKRKENSAKKASFNKVVEIIIKQQWNPCIVLYVFYAKDRFVNLFQQILHNLTLQFYRVRLYASLW